jgi:hypothetical protein
MTKEQKNDLKKKDEKTFFLALVCLTVRRMHVATPPQAMESTMVSAGGFEGD